MRSPGCSECWRIRLRPRPERRRSAGRSGHIPPPGVYRHRRRRARCGPLAQCPHRRQPRLHRGERAQWLRPGPYASGLEVGQGMYLRRGFTATGSGGDGAVRLVGAHIGGSLVGDGAKLCNDSGPALDADGLQVDQDMVARGEFTATGAGELGGSACQALTSAAASNVTGRGCATTPAPPWPPTASRSARACTSPAGSLPPAGVRVW